MHGKGGGEHFLQTRSTPSDLHPPDFGMFKEISRYMIATLLRMLLGTHTRRGREKGPPECVAGSHAALRDSSSAGYINGTLYSLITKFAKHDCRK